MYIYIYVCIYAYMYICVYIYIYIYVYICIHIWACVHVHLRTYIRTHTAGNLYKTEVRVCDNLQYMYRRDNKHIKNLETEQRRVRIKLTQVCIHSYCLRSHRWVRYRLLNHIEPSNLVWIDILPTWGVAQPPATVGPKAKIIRGADSFSR